MECRKIFNKYGQTFTTKRAQLEFLVLFLKAMEHCATRVSVAASTQLCVERNVPLGGYTQMQKEKPFMSGRMFHFRNYSKSSDDV
jgi:hypothetical protein